MTKSVSISKKSRKQHTPQFREEAPKFAAHIGEAAAARKLGLYESQQTTSSDRENEQVAEIACLKCQLAERNEELAILQKVATYFPKHLK